MGRADLRKQAKERRQILLRGFLVPSVSYDASRYMLVQVVSGEEWRCPIRPLSRYLHEAVRGILAAGLATESSRAELRSHKAKAGAPLRFLVVLLYMLLLWFELQMWREIDLGSGAASRSRLRSSSPLLTCCCCWLLAVTTSSTEGRSMEQGDVCHGTSLRPNDN